MTLDKVVKDEMKSEMTLTERVAMYIPGYRGYRERNLRREQDRAVRTELSRAIQGTKSDLAEIQRGLMSKPDLMMDIERIRTKVDRYDISVKKAVNGYSGFHDAVKITEEDLAALVEWDARLMGDIELMRQAASELLENVDEGRDVRAEVRNMERGVDSLIEDYNKREAVMKGFTRTEA